MRHWRAVAIFSALPLQLAVALARDTPAERLPEPAHQFAGEAARAVAEEERAWLRRASELGTLGRSAAEHLPGPGGLAAEAAALMGRSKQVLTAYQSAERDLQRFRSLLRKEAGHYRDVAELYVAAARQSKTAPVQEDYQALADAYRHRAAASEARAGALGLSAEATNQAQLVEEGNRFLERLAEAVAAVPVGAADERLLSSRLRRHAGQCDAVAAELSRVARALLAGSEDDAMRGGVKPPTKAPVGERAAPGLSVKETSSPARQVSFPLWYIRPTRDWAGIRAGPSDLCPGDTLTCERPGAGSVGSLQVVSYSSDAHVFVVRALGSTRFAEGDSAHR
jgi:hypothetical protein